jgi:eukaryotic-like serine/threonine-protein kinase
MAALAVTYGVFFLAAMRVANRAREVKVPDVRGKSVAAATDALGAAGLLLRVDPNRAPDPKVPADHVLSQTPDPGTTLRSQRSVRVRVSDGQRDPFVPSVVGQSERDAEAALQQAHVAIESRAEIWSGLAPGQVVAQDPPAKTRAAAVALLINRSAVEQAFVMPDLIGLPAQRVLDILRQRDFRVPQPTAVSYPGLQPGIVVRQTPQAGFRILAGDLISLEVSR